MDEKDLPANYPKLIRQKAFIKKRWKVNICLQLYELIRDEKKVLTSISIPSIQIGDIVECYYDNLPVLITFVSSIRRFNSLDEALNTLSFFNNNLENEKEIIIIGLNG
jgi:hypothetical protein